MLQTLRNAWKIPELRKKIIFTMFILLIYRVGNVIPVPYIDTVTLASYFDSVLSTTILGLYNAMSGSAFSQASVFALSIQDGSGENAVEVACESHSVDVGHRNHISYTINEQDEHGKNELFTQFRNLPSIPKCL